jgi:hypothetical protein
MKARPQIFGVILLAAAMISNGAIAQPGSAGGAVGNDDKSISGTRPPAKSWRTSVALSIWPACAAGWPWAQRCSGFTICQIGGIMAHAPDPPDQARGHSEVRQL